MQQQACVCAWLNNITKLLQQRNQIKAVSHAASQYICIDIKGAKRF